MDYELIHTSIDDSLLCAFFNNVAKYFLQEQLTIFLNKVMDYQSFFSLGRNIVFDRSLFEDIFIFADYFIAHKEKFQISEEDVNAYKFITDRIYTDIPAANLTIFCTTPVDICLKRLHKRKRREYELLYPNEHLIELHEQYRKIMPKIDTETMYLIDTNIYDITKIDIQDAIINDVNKIINKTSQTDSLLILKHFMK